MKKLESKTVKELIAMAREWGLSGYSRLKKAELLKLLTKKSNKTGHGSTKKSKTKQKPSNSKSAKKTSTPGSLAKKARALASKARLTRRKISRQRAEYSKPEITELSGAKKSSVTGKKSVSRTNTGLIQEPTLHASKAIDTGLPLSYGDGRFGLMARDPHWLYCFWDLTPKQQQKLWSSGHAVLRVLSTGKTGRRVVETISLKKDARSWYVHVKDADVEYFCELCCIEPDDSLTIVSTSNPSTTPPDFASRQKEQKERIKSVSTDLKSAIPKTALRPEQGKSKVSTESKDDSSNKMTFAEPSPGIFPGSMSHQHQMEAGIGRPEAVGHSPSQQGALFHVPETRTDKNDYWLTMDADLVIYGATQPGSRLVLAKVPIELDDNGHFRARFAFPDGSHAFTLEATSPDESQRKKISIKVTRRTDS